jgi:hypothetical protein
MKGLITILILGLSINSQIEQGHYIDPQKLSWLDYTGQINYNLNTTAHTHSRFLLGFSPKDSNDKEWKGDYKDMEIRIEFISDSSFVDWHILSYQSKEIQDYLFNHERLHYYITFLFAKKLKVYIISRKIHSIKELLKADSAYSNMSHIFNANYDQDTQHSNDTARQRFWNTTIMKGLDSLKDVKLNLPDN